MGCENMINKRYCKFVKQSKAKQSKAKPLLYLLNNFKFYISQFFKAFNFLNVFIRSAKNQFAILNNNVALAHCVNNSKKSIQRLVPPCYKNWNATPSLRLARNDGKNNFATLNLVKSFLTLFKFNFDNLFGIEFPFSYKYFKLLRRF